jgi:hypothetical protein
MPNLRKIAMWSAVAAAVYYFFIRTPDAEPEEEPFNPQD